MNKPRSGYTLPVFACAAAVAALRSLLGERSVDKVELDLIEPSVVTEISIEQVARINENMALAITRSEPGDNLDITSNTPVWALVEWRSEGEQIRIEGGEGIGCQLNNEGKAAIYSYAHKLISSNLQPHLDPTAKIAVRIILPEGRRLARRTSNAAFGVVEGLSLLGTTGISQPLSAPGQLAQFREELAMKARQFPDLVFCVGENGLNLARKLHINPARLVKTANWLGPMLVTAGLEGVRSILLFGYHGKLIKLAGGIFHTHNHLADARLEILTAHCALAGLPTPMLEQVFACDTTEAAYQQLRELGNDWVEKVYGAIAATIDRRSTEYIRKHGETEVLVGSVLFSGEREIILPSANGQGLLETVSSFVGA